MRWLAVVCAAWLIAGQGVAAAEPATPLLDPLRRQREDAQRMRDQQRALEGKGPPSDAPAPVAAPMHAQPQGSRSNGALAAVLFSTGAVSGSVALALIASSGNEPSQPEESGDLAWAIALLGISGVSFAAGVAVLRSRPSMQVAPTVTSGAIGLAVSGRL